MHGQLFLSIGRSVGTSELIQMHTVSLVGDIWISAPLLHTHIHETVLEFIQREINIGIVKITAESFGFLGKVLPNSFLFLSLISFFFFLSFLPQASNGCIILLCHVHIDQGCRSAIYLPHKSIKHFQMFNL